MINEEICRWQHEYFPNTLDRMLCIYTEKKKTENT